MNKITQTPKLCLDSGVTHSLLATYYFVTGLNLCCLVLTSTSRLSPPPTSPCPAWWSSCFSSRRRCLAGMSVTLPSPSCRYATSSCLPFKHKHRNVLYFNVGNLIVFCRWSVSWTSSQEEHSVTSWLPLTSSRVIKDGRNVFPHGSKDSCKNTGMLIKCVLCED